MDEAFAQKVATEQLKVFVTRFNKLKSEMVSILGCGGDDLSRLGRLMSEWQKCNSDLKAIWDFLEKAVVSGRDVSGWKKVQKRAVRSWGVDDKELRERIKWLIDVEGPDLGLTVDRFYVTQPISPSKASDLFPGKALPQILDDAVVKNSSGFKAVPE